MEKKMFMLSSWGKNQTSLASDTYRSLWTVYRAFLEAKFECTLTINDGYRFYDPRKGATPVAAEHGEHIIEIKPYDSMQLESGAIIGVATDVAQFVPLNMEPHIAKDKNGVAIYIALSPNFALKDAVLEEISNRKWEDIYADNDFDGDPKRMATPLIFKDSVG